MRRMTRLFLLVLVLWLPATAASADPAGPTNYRSTLTSAPSVEGVEISVFGGDAFLVVEVAPGSGHEVVVYGYEHSADVQDPYLRIAPDGTVEVNRRSPSRWKNQDRYQAIEVPDFVDASAPPDWELVGTGGSYAWHDHRIHWMSTALPPTIDPAGGVQVVPLLEDWRVPITIDGVDFEVAGTLTWEPSPTPIPWLAVGLVAAAVTVVVGRRSTSALFAAVAGAAVVALAIGGVSTLGLPPGVGVVLALVLLPAAAVVVAVAARARGGEATSALLAVAGLPLVGWAWLQVGVLTKPVIPSSVPVSLLRAVVVLVVGIAVGAVAAAVTKLFGGSLEDLATLADAEASQAD